MTNPYEPPESADLQLSVDHSDIRKRVSGPATGLIILSSIQAVYVTVHLVSVGFGYVLRNKTPEPVLITALLTAHLVGLIVISIGAAKLGFLESFRMARIGSVLACIPFVSPFFWIGIPLGIWSLRLLADPSVRNAFPDRIDTDTNDDDRTN